MVLSHDKFENLYDLNGKTIGVEKGSISHYTLLQALHKAGLTQSDVRFEFKTMSELITLFKKKKLTSSVHTIRLHLRLLKKLMLILFLVQRKFPKNL